MPTDPSPELGRTRGPRELSVDHRAGAGNAGRCRTTVGTVMRTQGLVLAGIGVVVGALAVLRLVKLLTYYRANRAPNPSRLPGPLPGPFPGPNAGAGGLGADGQTLTDAHGKPVLVRHSDLTAPPPLPPWEIHAPDPPGTVRRTKRNWFTGMVTEMAEVPPQGPRHYRLGDDGKVYCIEEPSEPGLTPLP